MTMCKSSNVIEEGQDFKRFLVLMPHGEDRTLVILKGHLLIEEKLRQIIDNHVVNKSPIIKAKLSFIQVIYLVRAFIKNYNDSWVWGALKLLNNLRNSVAHSIEQPDVDLGMEKFISLVKCNSVFSKGGFDKMKQMECFELSLWVLFVKVSTIEASNP